MGFFKLMISLDISVCILEDKSLNSEKTFVFSKKRHSNIKAIRHTRHISSDYVCYNILNAHGLYAHNIISVGTRTRSDKHVHLLRLISIYTSLPI